MRVIASRTIVTYLWSDRSCGNRYITSMVIASTPKSLATSVMDMEVIVMDAVVLARNDPDLGPRDGFHEQGLKAPDSVGIMYR